ncbi:MAG: HAD-IC family P-type ATPase, partial [Atopobiaceae bacterium]|nr:HAD-IC family P-type ATPase [Atopobiaceae bacterium]
RGMDAAGRTCAIGKPGFARSLGCELGVEVLADVERMNGMGATALLVICGDAVMGVVAVADSLRPGTPDTIAALKDAAVVRSLEMLTGDSTKVAATVAEQSGVTAFSAELLPEDKVARIRELQGSGEVVAMVGDGINDAPALATADLGITMGAAASDTALEVADVALLSDDLAQLPAFFRLAVRTMHIVRENIAFAIGVKALVFVLVVLGFAGMGAAVFADTGVALIVILNGMRLMLDSRSRW